MIQNFKDIENSALELDEKHRAQLARRLLLSLEDYIEENGENLGLMKFDVEKMK